MWAVPWCNANSCILTLSVLETNLVFAYAAHRKHNCMRKLICSSFYKLPKLSKSMSNQFYTEPSSPVKHSKHASNCLLFCISDKMSTQRVESRTSDEQLCAFQEPRLINDKKCVRTLFHFCFIYLLLLLKSWQYARINVYILWTLAYWFWGLECKNKFGTHCRPDLNSHHLLNVSCVWDVSLCVWDVCVSCLAHVASRRWALVCYAAKTNALSACVRTRHLSFGVAR